MMKYRTVDLSVLRRARQVIAVTAASVAFAGTAFAQNSTQKADTGAAASPAEARAVAAQSAFKRLDINKDGKLSRDEAQRSASAASHFDAWETDKDGSLSAEEFSAGFGAQQPQR
jgi:hypothetical protein